MRRILTLTTISILMLQLTSCQEKGHVLVEVNGKKITQEQFDAYLKLKRIPATNDKRREKALEEYVRREGLAAVIAAEGKLDQAMVEAEVNEFRKEMLLSRYFDKFLTEQVSEERVQNSYGTDASKYETKKVHAAHILIRTNKRMSEEQRKAKLTTAQEVHSKLQAGEPFEELAKQFSEDKISGRRGGDLGWIKEGTIDKRFSKRAFELKAGSVTEPFESPFGFHLLKVIEEPKTTRRPLGAVAGEIRYRLRNEAKDAERERLIKKVKSKIQNSYNPELTPSSEPITAPKGASRGSLAARSPSLGASPQSAGFGKKPGSGKPGVISPAAGAKKAPDSAALPPKTSSKPSGTPAANKKPGAIPAPAPAAPTAKPKVLAPPVGTPKPAAQQATPAPAPTPAPSN